jgi:mannan endo-1,4-beta-mannosidase
VTYKITNQWPGGFQASVDVKNNGSAAVNDWTLGWTFAGDQKITSLWSGSFTQTGSAVTVSAPGWATSIPAGTTANVGFTGSSSATATAPTAFTLNGTACTTG